MKTQNDELKIVDVTNENLSELGIFCIKDKKAAGYHAKVEWFQSNIKHGLTIKIAMDQNDKQIGFIEYIPSELAWRPVQAKNYLFVQCIVLFAKDTKNKGVGSALLQACEEDALRQKKSGVCAMSSDGTWIANKSLFEKNSFQIADKLGRFELMTKQFDETMPPPKFFDWRKVQADYSGWNLIYSDQCPWHHKSVVELSESAKKHNIELKVRKLTSPKEAQNAPSGFGSFSLIKDGKLLEDHYLSKTRFENILKQELK